MGGQSHYVPDEVLVKIKLGPDPKRARDRRPSGSSIEGVTGGAGDSPFWVSADGRRESYKWGLARATCDSPSESRFLLGCGGVRPSRWTPARLVVCVPELRRGDEFCSSPWPRPNVGLVLFKANLWPQRLPT